MGSRRLPGKVLAEIVGRPMTWHIVTRLRQAELLENVVIAVPDEGRDEPIRRFASAEAIQYYAGSESDMIDRLYQTALAFGAEAIVRVTGDCPLVDPEVVDRLVEAYLADEGEVEYVSNVRPPTFPHGLGAEVYPTSTLQRLWNDITDPFYREWFPVYFWERESQFVTCNIHHPEDLSHLRWTVDYPEDLEFVRRVYEALYTEGGAFSMAEVLELLASRPEFGAINSMYPCDNGVSRALAENARSGAASAKAARSEAPQRVF